MRACHIWQCYLTVYSFERMRCNVKGEHHIMYEKRKLRSEAIVLRKTGGSKNEVLLRTL